MGSFKDRRVIAEICGAILGDGWIQSNERNFFIAGNPQEDKEYYDFHLSKLIERIFSINLNPRHFPYWKVYGIAIYKKQIIRTLMAWGIPKGEKAILASTPKWIIKGPSTFKIAFLRGLFDTDGSVFCQKDYTLYATPFNSKYHSKIRLRINSISKKLIKQASQFCLTLGFKPVMRSSLRDSAKYGNRNDVYLLEINELQGIKRWFTELKPGKPKHITKYQVWAKFGFCPSKTTLAQRKAILKNEINPYLLYEQE